MNRKMFFIFLVVLFFAVKCFAGQVPFGLWVECQGRESTLKSLQNIDAMLQDAENMGIKDLFIQVHRGGYSWMDSSYADKTPYSDFLSKEGIDPINYILQKSKENGMNVHLWINAFRLLRNKNAPIVQEFGTKIMTRDGKKRLILNYPPSDLPDGGYWLDPGDLQVQEYMTNLVAEAVKKYPDCAGVHLDFVRYPYRVPFYPGSRWAAGRGFGYGVDSVKRFKEKTGLNAFEMKLNRENTQLWDNWRRDQVSAFVSKVNNVCKSAGKQISVAGICWADRAYLSAFQDWRGWLEEGIVDFVVSMNYSTDKKFAKYLSREAVVSKSEKKSYIGLGAYLLVDQPENLSDQINDAVGFGADGIVIFSYDVIKPSSEIKNLIKSKVIEYNK